MNNNSIRKTIAYGIGNVLAWYSYTLFMPFLILLAQAFFPSGNDSQNMLVGLMAFGCGLITRPFGSYIFGRIGDLICTEKAVGISYLLLAISTAGIGFIPSYEECGILSSILLILARSLQGIAMGGAGNVSLVQLVEIAPPKYKSLVGCIPNASNLIGLFISNLVFSFLYFEVNDISHTQYWRIPFLAGFVLLIFAYLQFREMKCSKNKSPVKLSLDDIKKYKLEIFCTFLFTALSAISYYFVFAFLPNYSLSHFGENAINSIIITNIILVISVFLGGYLSDKFGQIPVLFFVFGNSFLAGLIPLCFDHKDAISLLIPSLGVSLAAYYGASAAFFASLFPSGVRCTLIAVTMSISQAMFGSTAPLIANGLTSYSFKLITVHILFICVCAILTLLLIRRKRKTVKPFS